MQSHVHSWRDFVGTRVFVAHLGRSLARGFVVWAEDKWALTALGKGSP